MKVEEKSKPAGETHLDQITQAKADGPARRPLPTHTHKTPLELQKQTKVLRVGGGEIEGPQGCTL